MFFFSTLSQSNRSLPTPWKWEDFCPSFSPFLLQRREKSEEACKEALLPIFFMNTQCRYMENGIYVNANFSCVLCWGQPTIPNQHIILNSSTTCILYWNQPSLFLVPIHGSLPLHLRLCCSSCMESPLFFSFYKLQNPS